MLSLVTIGLSGCVGSDASTEAESVTLVLDWTPNTNHAGVYLALESGWYREAGIDLKIIEPGNTGGLQALASGNAEFAVSVQEELTPAVAAGVPVVSIAAIIEHNTSSLMSLSDAGIGRPADLTGRRYGGWGGQLEQAIVDALVACDGGDPAAVEFVSVGDADYRVGLESGRYDSVWVFDGWDKIRFEQAGLDVSTIEFADQLACIPDWYTPLFATSAEMIEERPDLVERFVAVTARGYRTAIADPEEAADALMLAAPELDPRLVEASAAYLAGQYSADPARWGYQDPAVWEEFTEFLEAAGMLDGPVDVSAAFTNDFVASSD